MLKLSGNELREKFIEYFKKEGHTAVSSSSLVPIDDPTLLFTNAGMVQFKDIFLGLEERDYNRAVTAQKCVRAGGKHNDLDTVGRTARHHTFFEMMGNFSFGDYFKRDAIKFAWNFLVNELQIPKEKLWATIYLDDDEAYDLWLELTDIPAERILRLGEEDNYWSMGDTGPCGPCSELLVDRGSNHACDDPDCGIGNCDCDRWLEIWNLVFMQFNRDEAGELTPLPKPSIDTGMGLERVASVLQEVDSNYDTDLIKPLIKGVEVISKSEYQGGEQGFPFIVIADHVRSCTFLINDGVLPSNEGRGYVLRRILRRAVRFGKVLAIEKPFMYQLVGTVVELMGNAYPELKEKRDYIEKVIKIEEERFHETLHDGMKIVNDMIKRIKSENKTAISGKDAFVLYDTYGFPFDLTEDIAEEHKLEVDKAGFEKAMEEQRQRARAARQDVKAGEDAAFYTKDLGTISATEFVGYDNLTIKSKVLGILEGETGKRIKSAQKGDEVAFVLDDTPFYPEGGGQVADQGKITNGSGTVKVNDVFKLPDGKIIHKGVVESGEIQENSEVEPTVDAGMRTDTCRNHTATHILHKALKATLGDHVNQAGSLVTPDRLRFDFNHFSAVTEAELEEIEQRVNDALFANYQIETFDSTFEKAKEMGAAALFGEKYGDVVRVVKMGDYSVELCGGTHLNNTGQVGLFKIVSETGIGAGLRRIEAVTGQKALELVNSYEKTLKAAAKVLKTPLQEVDQRADNLLIELKEKEKELEGLKTKLAANQVDDLLTEAVKVKDIAVLAKEVQINDMDGLRNMADLLRNKLGSGVVVLGAKAGAKVNLVAMATKDVLKAGVHAGNLIKEVAKITGGGGGGRPDMAQAGGKKPEKLAEAMSEVTKLVDAQLK